MEWIVSEEFLALSDSPSPLPCPGHPIITYSTDLTSSYTTRSHRSPTLPGHTVLLQYQVTLFSHPTRLTLFSYDTRSHSHPTSFILFIRSTCSPTLPGNTVLLIDSLLFKHSKDPLKNFPQKIFSTWRLLFDIIYLIYTTVFNHKLFPISPPLPSLGAAKSWTIL